MHKSKRILILLLFISSALFAEQERRGKDSTNIYGKIDTNYITNFRDLLNAKLFAVIRNNKFSVEDRNTQSSIEYGINSKLNMGIGLSFKGIGFDLEYSPPGINVDDDKYGKTTSFAIGTSSNARRFMYDVFYRQSQGFRTSAQYRVENDTVFDYYRRSDIYNYNAGLTLTYVFNNKRYSSSAPYSLTQKQRKSAGSFLLGTYAQVYGISADTIIYPDTMYRSFRHELQFNAASSFTFGISCGYAYTLVFGKNWFVNVTTLPGISLQEFYTVNAFDKEGYNTFSLGLSLQSRFSIGYNRRSYFIGVSFITNNFFIDDHNQASINYKYSTFKFYYGHRFDLRKMLKKKL